MSNDSVEDAARRIDSYIEELCSSNDEALSSALENMERNGLPHINVSANEGKLLYMLVKLSGATRVLEIGTLGGYSTIWMARALPAGGRLLTLEYEPRHAAVAHANIVRAGLSDRIEVRLGAALDLLPEIERSSEGPFDLFFIDADKENYPGYLEWAIKLSRPGSVILSDNLIRNGSVINPPPDDPIAVVINKYNRELATNPQLETIILPIIRENTDGLGITIVKAPPAS
ncbi:MAG: O-methyltransferase [Chloroflexi bacterium]|nr:O-methyltransferase [Chloroflexota bacterium]